MLKTIIYAVIILTALASTAVKFKYRYSEPEGIMIKIYYYINKLDIIADVVLLALAIVINDYVFIFIATLGLLTAVLGVLISKFEQ